MRYVSYTGSKTMGIYIVQTILVEMMLARYLDLSWINSGIRDCVVLPLGAILLTIVCYGVYLWISKSSVLKLVLFGEQVIKKDVKE